MRVAVIGLGQMGRNHARVMSELCVLSATVDSDAASRAAAVSRYQVPTYESAGALLANEDIDAAVVATPTMLHEPICRALIDRGVHFLVEKPVAQDVLGGQRIARAARAAGVVAQVGHIERFNPALLAMKAKLDEGLLGRIFSLSARRVGPFPPRIRDVGVTHDLAVHDLDVARVMLGEDVDTLFARCARRVHETHEDLVTIVGSTPSGVVVSFEINWVTPRKVRETTVVGEHGMLIADTLTQDLYHYANNWEPASWMPVLRGVSEGDMTRYALRRIEPLRAQADAFLRAVQGAPVEGATLADGIAAIRLAEAAVTSAGRGLPVHLAAA